MTNKSKPDLYKILGISRSSTLIEVKQAYRKLSKQYHPDKNQKDPEKYIEMFKKISKAYEILSDPVSRKKYDKETKSWWPWTWSRRVSRVPSESGPTKQYDNVPITILPEPTPRMWTELLLDVTKLGFAFIWYMYRRGSHQL